MNFVCINNYENDVSSFIKGKTYSCAEVKQGIMFVPWVIKEASPIIIEDEDLENSRYSKKSINSKYYEEMKIEGDTQPSELSIIGYNVVGEEGFINYFVIEKFNKYFKLLKELRKEKLGKLNI